MEMHSYSLEVGAKHSYKELFEYHIWRWNNSYGGMKDDSASLFLGI